MDFAPFENVVAWPALAGYLNFAEGRPDPRFQKQLSDLYAHCAAGAAPRPWEVVHAAFIFTARGAALSPTSARPRQ
jgi:hypothetical protein